MKKNKNLTWLGYFDTVKTGDHETEAFDLDGFDDFFNANCIAKSFFRHSVPIVYLLDYRRGAYIKMSEDFAGYGSECFLNNGISHTLDIYQRDHLRLFNQEIFPDRLQVLKDIKPEEHKDYVFSYNVAMRNRKGELENYLQRNCFLSDAQGNPVLSIGMLVNVSHYINGNIITQTVDKISKASQAAHETIYKKVYHLHEEDKLFSKREKEVLLWMADGLSSKMIADKMCVSEHTVINHRRSMQHKSNMPNALALVSFAVKNGII